jgi:hypothetical protein
MQIPVTKETLWTLIFSGEPALMANVPRAALTGTALTLRASSLRGLIGVAPLV